MPVRSEEICGFSCYIRFLGGWRKGGGKHPGNRGITDHPRIHNNISESQKDLITVGILRK